MRKRSLASSGNATNDTGICARGIRLSISDKKSLLFVTNGLHCQIVSRVQGSGCRVQELGSNEIFDSQLGATRGKIVAERLQPYPLPPVPEPLNLNPKS